MHNLISGKCSGKFKQGFCVLGFLGLPYFDSMLSECQYFSVITVERLSFNMYFCTCLRVCVCAFFSVNVCVCVRVCAYARAHARACVCLHTCIPELRQDKVNTQRILLDRGFQ